MRNIALLALLLPLLAATPAALASEFDVELLQKQLIAELQGQIDRTVLEVLTARVEQQLQRGLRRREDGRATAMPIGAGQLPARTAAVETAGSDSSVRPSRMNCRASAVYDLDCVVVSRRSGRSEPERVAQVP